MQTSSGMAEFVRSSACLRVLCFPEGAPVSRPALLSRPGGRCSFKIAVLKSPKLMQSRNVLAGGRMYIFAMQVAVQVVPVVMVVCKRVGTCEPGIVLAVGAERLETMWLLHNSAAMVYRGTSQECDLRPVEPLRTVPDKTDSMAYPLFMPSKAMHAVQGSIVPSVEGMRTVISIKSKRISDGAAPVGPSCV